MLVNNKNSKTGGPSGSQDKKQESFRESEAAEVCRAAPRPEAGSPQGSADTTSSVTRGVGITNKKKRRRKSNNKNNKKLKNKEIKSSFKSFEPEIERLLLAGIDSLDLGVYVDWGLARVALVESLAKYKKLAAGDDFISWPDSKIGPCLLYASAGKRTYRYHLQYPAFHAYMFKTIPQESTPDIYISLNAKTLWTIGPQNAVTLVTNFLDVHGVTIKKIVPSRCDIAADFLIPSGMCLPWFLNHMVPGIRKNRPWMNGTKLETLYLGEPKSDIQIRIYDKSGREKNKDLEFFNDLWQLDEPENVWRFEIQLRRQALRTFGIESPENLFEKLGGLWRNISSNWFSLRALDDSNTSRRSILPFWVAVQDVAKTLGADVPVKRTIRASGRAGPQWYINRAASLLPGYAAPMGLENLDDAVEGFAECIRSYWLSDYKDFDNAYVEKLVKAGLAEGGKGNTNEIPF